MAQRGRPSHYLPEYCQDIIDFFSKEEDPYYVEEVTTTGKSWTRTEKQRVGRKLPTLARWCVMHGIHRQTMLEWAERYPDFGDALARAKEAQEDLLANGGLLGVYDSRFAGLVAMNFSGWKTANVAIDGDLRVTHLRDPQERHLLASMADRITKAIQGQGELIELPAPEEE